MKQTITRLIAVAGSALTLGYALYRSSIFVPTMRVSQFAMSGVTMAIAYAAWKARAVRNGLAALFVWYVCLTTLIVPFNWWLLILDSFYIAGMTAAVLVHQSAVVPRLRSYPLLRVALAGAITSIANGLIIVALFLFSCLFLYSWQAIPTHLDAAYGNIYFNLNIGALIGLGVGIGMEIAEYLNGRFFQPTGQPVKNNTVAGNGIP